MSGWTNKHGKYCVLQLIKRGRGGGVDSGLDRQLKKNSLAKATVENGNSPFPTGIKM